MARFEIDSYLACAEEELKAAKTALALAVTPLLFFLSTLGYVGKLAFLAKLAATVSVVFFAVAIGIWGTAAAIGQISIVAIKFERAKKVDGVDLEDFVDKNWLAHNEASAKLFKRAVIPFSIGMVGFATFIAATIWA